MRLKINRTSLLALLTAVTSLPMASVQAQPTAIPPSFSMPAGSVDTSKPGFLARPYQTSATHAGSLAWTEDQLAGLHGPNLADLSGADTNGYYAVPTVVNWNITAGGTVDNFAAADLFPGIGGAGTVNFSEEVITYIEFPAAGVYTMGVNSDDGFGVAVASLNPKDGASALSVGQYNLPRGAGDTTFQVSVSQAGIYPFRLLYFQVGGGASLSWFTVLTDTTSTNSVLINDLSTTGALKAYAAANIAPPYANRFAHNPTGFAFNINDGISALAPSSLVVTFNGATVAVTTTKAGPTTTVNYTAPALIQAGPTNTVTVQFTDNAQPAHNGTASFSYAEAPYASLPPAIALPATAVDTTQRGFLYRVHQIDSAANGVLAANIAHAEAQLAGLVGPQGGQPYPNIATAGTQPDGSFVVGTVINFSYDLTAEEGAFNSANGHGDAAFPGLSGASSEDIAGEIVTYLELKTGFYNFAVNHADGFRVAAAANPYDQFGVQLGLFDIRTITTETQFGVLVQADGIYPVRLVFFRQNKMADNSGDFGLEFYTVKTDGTKVLVNDSTDATAVKAYWKRTSAFGTFVKHAGPTAFVSKFAGTDVGFKSVNISISDGSTDKVDATSVALTIDGSPITATAASASGLTTLSYTPTGIQLPRTVHSAQLIYGDVGGSRHTNTWSFNLLRNYVLPAPLYFEDFESTAAGPDPLVPTGWVAENHTGPQDVGNDTSDLNSDFYLGWVVVDKSFAINKDFGVSAFAPQELNGSLFVEDTNPLLVNHYMRAESDSRQNGPPGQIQYVTTPVYDLSTNSGVVIAFDSAYEKNQDDIVGIEYTVDGGTTWKPVFYFLQDGYDSQGVTDIFRDGQGNIDVLKTMLTPYGDVAKYTDASGQLVGGYFGFFLKAPITSALAPYIEGRVNDDGTESKRIELFRVPGADNQKTVKFRLFQAGTSSWYWAIDNWGIYSVPSLAGPVGPPPASGQPTDLGQTVNGFQDDFTGATRDPNWVPVGPGGDLYSQANGLLSVSVQAGDPNHLLYEAPGYSNTVQEVLARIRVTAFAPAPGTPPNTDAPRGGIGVGVGTNSQGINLHFRDNDQDGVPGRQFKLLDDSRAWGPPGLRTNVPGQTTPGWTNNTWYWMRLRQEPNANAGTNDVFAKVWLADGVTPEPTDWQLTWNYVPTRSVRTGFAGITGSSINGVSHFDVDYVLIKADGLPSIKVDFSPTGPAPASLITITRNAQGDVVLTFDGTLQSADQVTGPYTDVQGATSPRTVTPSGTMKFYRSFR